MGANQVSKAVFLSWKLCSDLMLASNVVKSEGMGEEEAESIRLMQGNWLYCQKNLH